MPNIEWPDLPILWELHDRYGERWSFAYPGLDVDREVIRMAEWLEANPRKRPKNYKRFAVAWLARSQNALERVELREAIRREEQRQKAVPWTYRRANG